MGTMQLHEPVSNLTVSYAAQLDGHCVVSPYTGQTLAEKSSVRPSASYQSVNLRDLARRFEDAGWTATRLTHRRSYRSPWYDRLHVALPSASERLYRHRYDASALILDPRGGRGSLQIFSAPIRVLCTNQLSAIPVGRFSHTGTDIRDFLENPIGFVGAALNADRNRLERLQSRMDSAPRWSWSDVENVKAKLPKRTAARWDRLETLWSERFSKLGEIPHDSRLQPDWVSSFLTQQEASGSDRILASLIFESIEKETYEPLSAMATRIGMLRETVETLS